MASYLSQRILLMIPSLIGTTILTFVLLRVLLPADAVDIILGEYGGNNPELRGRIEEDLGLSGSLAGQYLEWVGISWFFGGETGILLARADGDRQSAVVGDQFAGRVGFFLRANDFTATYARMVAAGVRFVTAPRREPYGDVAVFLDIEGNRWDLLGPDPG